MTHNHYLRKAINDYLVNHLSVVEKPLRYRIRRHLEDLHKKIT